MVRTAQNDENRSHFLGMAFAVEQDEAGGPAGVGLLGADGVVLEADGVTDISTELSAGLVEEFLGVLFHIRAPKCLTCRYFSGIIVQGQGYVNVSAGHHTPEDGVATALRIRVIPQRQILCKFQDWAIRQRDFCKISQVVGLCGKNTQ